MMLAEAGVTEFKENLFSIETVVDERKDVTDINLYFALLALLP